MDQGDIVEEWIVVKFWIHIKDKPIRFHDGFDADYDKREDYYSNGEDEFGECKENGEKARYFWRLIF